MKPYEFTYESKDGNIIYCYKWANENPKAVLQIAHGAVEHAKRYDDFANALVQKGYAVYANDHRGHGKTAGSPDKVAYFSDSKGGFSLAVDDAHELTKMIKKENEGKKVFLFGHSMGSSIARVYAAKFGNDIDGLLLTGTGRVAPFLVAVVRMLAKINMKIYGRKHKSPLLHSLIFGTLNKPFKGETGSEFICTDSAVIDKYNADEYCGNTITAEFAYELIGGTGQAAAKKTFENFPKEKPLFIGAGEFDSMGGSGLAAVKKDVAAYKKAGVHDLTFIVYENMRHEILNEKQRGKVYSDIVDWLDKSV